VPSLRFFLASLTAESNSFMLSIDYILSLELQLRRNH
jgi:hypothetical protein